jgi:CRP/FNR family transcriptional regulator
VQVSTTELAQLLRFDLAGYANADAASFTTRRIGEGETLYRAGDEFHSLYVVRSGFFKTLMLDPSGAEQVLAFPMTADVMGADGIASGRYTSEAIALEASEVVVVPFARISALARECPPLERVLYRVLSRELVREQGMLYVVGMLGAEGRVAAFLLNLGERFGALGYSRTSFNLRMTRQEIGSLLGLKLETVSRALSAFDAAGFIKVNLKRVDIVDAGALRAMMEEPIAPVLRSGAARVRSSGPSGLVGNGLKPSSLPA